MAMKPIYLPLAALALLAACDDTRHASSDDKGTDVRVQGADGKAVIEADSNSGRVSVDIGGLKGSVDLPRVALDAADFDMDGVKLYPGSKITGMDVKAGPDGDDDGSVTVRFTAPAAPGAVSDHFLTAFRKEEGTTVSVNAGGLSGKDEDGKPFTIELKPDGAGTTGVIRLGQGAAAQAAP
jgi:hypothetical protein